jgi:hypothetical protein
VVDFSHCDSVRLHLTFQPQYDPSEWKVDVVALGQNVRSIGHGVCHITYV